MDLELRKARADDGGADDDLGDIFWQSSTRAPDVCERQRQRSPCKLSGRLREKPVCWKAQTAMRQRSLDLGSGGDSKSGD